jgi:hypothetical protein
MAEKLRSRLDSTLRENERLQSKLDRQTNELEELRDERNYQNERIEDLEYQCVEKSSRISSLACMLENRQPNELEENLLQKSLEHAELSLSVDRLRMALSKCEKANRRLFQEKETLEMVNEQLSKKVEESTTAWHQAKKEQQQNRKLLLEMGDVVRSLNCVTVDFESTIPSQEHGRGSFENIKRKIHAMEEDRQKLIQECMSLREDNDSKHRRIRELESQSRSLSTTSRTTRSDEEAHRVTSSKPWSRPTRAARADTKTFPLSADRSLFGQEDLSTYISDAKRRLHSVASDVSSFSDLNAPPPKEVVPLEDHQQLKQYYEESLERIIHMSGELGKYQTDMQEQQAAIEILHERLDQTAMERDEARQEVEEALSLAEDAAGKQEGILQTHKDQMQALQDKYDQLDAEYAQQLQELEQQIAEAETVFQSQCEGIKQKQAHAIESLENQQKELKKAHDEELRAEKAKWDELNEELDVIMEIHTKMEEDLDDLQKKYDEALNTIVEFEDKVRNTTELSSTERAKLEKDVEEQAMLITMLKAKVDTSKEEMQEAVLQQQRLRRENEIVLAKHGQVVTELGKAKQQQIEDTATMKELRDNCCDMEERVQRAEHDSSTRFQQLHASYQMAITKITSMAHQLYQVGIPIEESCQEDRDSNTVEPEEENLAAHEKIKRLEMELMGMDPVKYPSSHLEGDAQKFYQDYSLILKNYARHRTSISKDDLPQPIWYDRLKHQFQMLAVQRALLRNVYRRDDSDMAPSFDSLLPDFIQHEMKMRRILEIAVRKVKSRFASTHEMKIETESPSSSTSHVTDPPRILVEPGFFEHQRLLTSVHYDIIARAEKLDSSRSSATYSSKWKSESPQDIGEAQLALLQLKGETHKIKLAANTAKIRYEAREKEHRVLRLQYHKLLEQYNQAVKKKEIEGRVDESPSDKSAQKVKTAVHKIQRDAELDCLKSELRNAELKVERIVTELRNTKTKAEHARKQQEEGERSLQDAIRHERQLGIPTEPQSPTTIKGQVTDIFRARGNRPLPMDEAPHTANASFDSRFNGDGGISGGERRLEGGMERFLQLQSDYDEATSTISKLERQLLDAENEAEHAKVQLKRREENLRDVIREYNQIKEKYDALMAQNQLQVKKEKETTKANETTSNQGGNETLIRERNVALGKISLLEAEVTEARRVAKEAHKKRIVRETQLRDVIEQYKELNQEHQKSVSMVEKLRGALARYEPPARGMEARQRSQESDEQSDDKRETSLRETSHGEGTTRLNNRSTPEYPGSPHSHQKNKTKLKSWFRDLGHQKLVR